MFSYYEAQLQVDHSTYACSLESDLLEHEGLFVTYAALVLFSEGHKCARRACDHYNNFSRYDSL